MITASVLLACLGVVLIGLVIVIAQSILPTPDPRAELDSFRQGLRLAGWVMTITGLAIGAIMLVGGIIGLVVVVILLMVVQRSRRARYQSMLWSLTIAAERGLPLVGALAAVAEEQGAFWGGRARTLARLLEAGWSLPDALDQVRGPITREALVAIRIGYQSGALPQALRHVLTGFEEDAAVWSELSGSAAYLALLICLAWAVATFMLIKITPAFQKIFVDFGASPPLLTQAVDNAAYVAVRYWYLFSPVFPLLAFLVFYAALRYIGWVDFELPGTSWLSRRRHTANLLDALALSTARGRPLAEALATISATYPAWWVRHRVRAALFDMDTGADWCESLWRHGLIGQAECSVLQAAQRVGNLPWALREMAASNRRRLAYRFRAVLQVLFPLAILSTAAVIGAFVISYFLPLIALIQKLS